jgi:hypothetical protein
MSDIEVGNTIRLEGKFDQLEQAISKVETAIGKVEAQTKSLNETSAATKKAAEGMWDLDRLQAYQSTLDTIVSRYIDITKQLMDMAIAGDKEVEVGRQFEQVWKGASVGLAESVTQAANYRLMLTESQQLLIRLNALHLDQYQAIELVAATSRIAVGLGEDQHAAQEAVVRSMETGEMRGLNLLHLSKEQKDSVKSTADLYELIVSESQKYAESADSAGKAAAHLQVALGAAEDSLAVATTESDRLRFSFEGMATATEAISNHMNLVISSLTAADFSGLGGLLQAATELIGRLSAGSGGPGVGAGIGPTEGMSTKEFLAYQMSLIPGGSKSGSLNKAGFGAGGAGAEPGVVDFSEQEGYADIISGSPSKASTAKKATKAPGPLTTDWAPGAGLGGAMGTLAGRQTPGQMLGIEGLAGMTSKPFDEMATAAQGLADTLSSSVSPALDKMIEQQKEIEETTKASNKMFGALGKTVSHDVAGALVSAARGEQSLGEAFAQAAEARGAQMMLDAAGEAVWNTAKGISSLGDTMGIPNPASIAYFTAAGEFLAIAAGGGLMMGIGSAAGGGGGGGGSSGSSSAGAATATSASFIPTEARNPGAQSPTTTVNNYYVEGNAIGDLSSLGVVTDQAQADARAKGLIA